MSDADKLDTAVWIASSEYSCHRVASTWVVSESVSNVLCRDGVAGGVTADATTMRGGMRGDSDDGDGESRKRLVDRLRWAFG